MLKELINRIHSPNKRIYVTSKLFDKSRSIKICLLDFVDAPDYFITEQGFIWNRKEFNYIKNNEIIWRNYLPLVIRDKYYRVPWVFLPTRSGNVWYPIDLLVGWAFHGTTDTNSKYFIHKGTELLDNTDIENSAVEPKLPDNSLYKQFLNNIYN